MWPLVQVWEERRGQFLKLDAQLEILRDIQAPILPQQQARVEDFIDELTPEWIKQTGDTRLWSTVVKTLLGYYVICVELESSGRHFGIDAVVAMIQTGRLSRSSHPLPDIWRLYELLLQTVLSLVRDQLKSSHRIVRTDLPGPALHIDIQSMKQGPKRSREPTSPQALQPFTKRPKVTDESDDGRVYRHLKASAVSRGQAVVVRISIPGSDAVTLTQGDLWRLIQPHAWLNDEVLNAWGAILNARSDSVHISSTRVWPKLENTSIEEAWTHGFQMGILKVRSVSIAWF